MQLMNKAMENQNVNEKIFYQDGDVRVTQSRYMTHAKTYAMRNISSVSVFKIAKSRRLPIIMSVVGGMMLFYDDWRIAGIFIAAIGLLSLFLIKNEFAVRISTNAGEVDSVVSKDKFYVTNIVSALNEAIIHIG